MRVDLESVVVRAAFGGDGAGTGAPLERDGDGPLLGERSGERHTAVRAHRFGSCEARRVRRYLSLVLGHDGGERGEVCFPLNEVGRAKRRREGHDASIVALCGRRPKIALGRGDPRTLDLGSTLGVTELEGRALHVVFAHLEQRRERAVFVPVHPTQHSQLAPHGNPGTLEAPRCVRARPNRTTHGQSDGLRKRAASGSNTRRHVPTGRVLGILGGMRAVLHDSEGPARNRLVPLVLLPVGILMAVLGAPALLTGAILTLGLCLPGVLFRFPARQVEVVPSGGALHVRGGGLRDQTISAADLTGASTARVAEGIALTLARKSRKSPTTLVFSSEEDLERAREALGVGHGGFGTITWPLWPGAAETWAPTARAVAALMTMAAFAFGVGSLFAAEGTAYVVLGWMMLVFAWMPAAFGILGALARHTNHALTLEPEGVSLRGFAPSRVPFEAISGIASKNGVFELGVGQHSIRAAHRTGGLAGASVDDESLRILGAQLAACVGRAKGLGPDKREARTRVDTLRRGQERARDWLARIDVAASALGASGYRGSTIERDDLWLLLRDPDAPEDLRAAAGRMLVKAETSPEVRVRVGDIVSAVRETEAQKRLRVAIFPELDPTGEELEELEESAKRRRLPPSA